MTRVKICGIRDAGVAVAAAEAGADFIGLMFAESRRKVTPEECYDVVEALHEMRRVAGPVSIAGPERGEVSARSWFGAWNEAIEEVLFRVRPLIVGVFAGQAADDVNNIADAAKLDIVQLSGREDDDYVRRIERPVLRAVHVAKGDDPDAALDRSPAGIAHAVMFDTASPTANGGTGATFDWTIAAEAARRVPLMLAGGLSPENVEEAVERVSPWAVDVSSGVETGGTKDIDKVRAFIRAAKGART